MVPIGCAKNGFDPFIIASSTKTPPAATVTDGLHKILLLIVGGGMATDSFEMLEPTMVGHSDSCLVQSRGSSSLFRLPCLRTGGRCHGGTNHPRTSQWWDPPPHPETTTSTPRRRRGGETTRPTGRRSRSVDNGVSFHETTTPCRFQRDVDEHGQ